MLGPVLLLALGVVVVATAWALSTWRPRPRWARRRGRGCPGCGGSRVRTVVSDDRLNGMLECRSCPRVWDPADHRG
ncbi:hypothetical protein ABT354_17790 [Streptomyces sp. NPDC000594]|uniref:hypothetical protein n=1 Tax=Streptomyces sp. NPDC000594 TaxID=3154261 RepID=UPI003328A236